VAVDEYAASVVLDALGPELCRSVWHRPAPAILTRLAQARLGELDVLDLVAASAARSTAGFDRHRGSSPEARYPMGYTSP
jgi:hypothetical protein